MTSYQKLIEEVFLKAKECQPTYLCFTQKTWDYIEKNLEPFFPGAKRIVLPDKVELKND